MLQESERSPEASAPPPAPRAGGRGFAPLGHAAVYIAFGAVWILLTDWFVDGFLADKAGVRAAQTAKGLLFIIASSAVVYWLARRAQSAADDRIAEARLLVTRSLLDKVLESLGEAVFVLDPSDRTIQRVNAAAERMFGYGVGELVGRTTRMLHLSDASFAEFGALSAGPLRDDGVFQCEFMMRRKDGEVIATAHTVATLHGDLGPADGVSLVVSVVRDVTALKSNERELRASADRFRQLIESLPAAVYVCDAQGRITQHNRAAREIWGRSPEPGEDADRYSGAHGIPRPDGDPLDKSDTPMARCLRTRQTVPGEELVFERPGGWRVHAIVSAAPLLGEGGELEGAVNCMLDLSARRSAEATLAEREKKYRLLADNTLDVIWSLDQDLVFTYLNPAVRTLTGFDAEELVGRPVWTILPESEHERIRSVIETMFEGGAEARSVRVESRLLQRAGGQIEVEIQGAVLYDDDGTPVGLQGTTRDITERISLEEQFRQSQKMESLGRLAGGVAHDFNNMLSVIIGCAELALREVATDHPLHGRLREILTAAERSADLTRRLLAVARKQSIAPRLLDLNAVIEDALAMLGRLIGEDVRLEWRPDREPWGVCADPAQIIQVLANLVVNSRDAIDGVGTVTIATGKASLPGDITGDITGEQPGAGIGEYVTLSVTDDGCGMERETLKRAFDPFFTTKPSGEGTGLGLAMVYGVVQQNDGFLEASSEVGRGTTIRICLPRAVSGPDSGVHVRGAPSERQGTETILVVEDEPALLALMRELVSGLGYQVLTAASPAEALEVFRAEGHRIALLVSDVVMPGMNGRELWEAVRELAPSTRCLFMSGYTSDVVAHRGGVGSGIRLIQKPFTVSDLSAGIRDALDEDAVP